jgi:hypothetical protein
MSHHELTDLVSFLAAIAGTLAAILLAFPLFHLLGARQGIEDLERKLDAPDLSDDQRAEMRISLYDLRLRVRERRRIAIRVAIAGVALLGLTAVLLVWQGVLLLI